MENKSTFSNQRFYLNSSTSSQPNYLCKVHELSRPPSVPVLGRKLSNESIITLRDESMSKYPYAVQPAPLKQLSSKLNRKLVQILRKPKKHHSNTQEHCNSRSNSPLSKLKTTKKTRKATQCRSYKYATNQIPHLKPPKTPEKRNQCQMKEIVEKSLKKQKNLKKNHEKTEKLKKEAKEKIKKNIIELSKAAREDNLKYFKQKLFNPRQVPGVDKKKDKKHRQQEEIVEVLSKRTRFDQKFKSVSPEVSPSKRCLSSRAKNSSKPKSKKKKTRNEKESLKVVQVKLNPEALTKPYKKKTAVKTIKKCQEMKWLDRYLENMSELSNLKSITLENQSKIPEFGIVDNFEIFEENSEIPLEPKLKNIEKISMPKLRESFVFEDPGLSSEFILEENSKIIRLKKINKQKSQEIQDKISISKAKVEEQYLNDKFVTLLQAAAKGWLVREEIKYIDEVNGKNDESISQVGKNSDFKSFIKVSPNFEGNSENSWIYKRQYTEDIDSFLNDDEEFNDILKVFKIKTNRFRGIDEKSQDLKSKHLSLASISSPDSKAQIQPSPGQKLQKNLKENLKDSNERKKKLKDLPWSRNLTSEEERKSEIISLAPISKGHNLNLNEITYRLLQEQHNLDILEEESKEMLIILTPQSPKQQKTLSMSPKLSNEDEILRLFQEIIVKKYTNIGLILDQNIKVLKDAFADSLTSKSKTESVELKNKLKKISTEESSEDLDQILKELIGTQEIYKIEVEVLQDYIHSFPGSRNSPVPNTLTEYTSHQILVPENFEIPHFKSEHNLEDILSRGSSYKETEIFDQFDIYLNDIEDQLITSLVLDSMQDYIVNFSEDLLLSLIETQTILINHEFKLALSDKSLYCFTDQVMNRYKSIILSELSEFKEEDPADLLAMMQESEIGSGHFPEILFAVIDPKFFIDTVQEDSLFVCIFKKMVFDCINENLNKFISKLPTPWGDGRLTRKNLDFDGILKEILKNISKNNELKMGKIYVEGETDMGINNVREEKIMKVINYESQESEGKWLDYGFDENQVKLDLADMILETLVEEAIEISINK